MRSTSVSLLALCWLIYAARVCVCHVHEPFEEDQVHFQVILQLRFIQSVYLTSSLGVKPSSDPLSDLLIYGSDHCSRGLIGVSFQREHIGLALEAKIGLTLWRRNFILNFSTHCI
jgi:hypothetical protein